MASSGIRRKVDDLGRVVIPAGMRRTLGIREGDPVEVTVEGERVVLAKPRDACVFCGREEEQLTDFRGRLVCRDCLASLSSVEERRRATARAQQPSSPATPPTAVPADEETGGPAGRASPAPGTARSVADLPEWDAPRRRAPASPSSASEPEVSRPTAQERDQDTDQDTGQDTGPAAARPTAGEARDEQEPSEEPPQRPRRRPPYDPASTTAW